MKQEVIPADSVASPSHQRAGRGSGVQAQSHWALCLDGAVVARQNVGSCQPEATGTPTRTTHYMKHRSGETKGAELSFGPYSSCAVFSQAGHRPL